MKITNYIETQAAIDVVHKSILGFFDICDDEESPMTYKDKRLLELNKVITTQIKAVPPADVVEVVHCKDCKHYDLALNGFNGMCNRQYATFYAVDFCSYGERNE